MNKEMGPVSGYRTPANSVIGIREERYGRVSGDLFKKLIIVTNHSGGTV
jgi:hypothetical protein